LSPADGGGGHIVDRGHRGQIHGLDVIVVFDGPAELDQPDVVLESMRIEIWMVDVDGGGQKLAIGIVSRDQESQF
jgi:hypothetical protein